MEKYASDSVIVYKDFFSFKQQANLAHFVVDNYSEKDWEKHVRTTILEQVYGQYQALKEDEIQSLLASVEGNGWHNSSIVWQYTNLFNLFEEELIKIDVFGSLSNLTLLRHAHALNKVENKVILDEKLNVDNRDWVFLYFLKIDEGIKVELIFADLSCTILVENNDIVLIKPSELHDFIIKNYSNDFIYYTKGWVKKKISVGDK